MAYIPSYEIIQKMQKKQKKPQQKCKAKTRTYFEQTKLKNYTIRKNITFSRHICVPVASQYLDFQRHMR